MKYHEKPALFKELFSNLLPILLALFVWVNPVQAQNQEDLITLSLTNKTVGEALETINKRYNYTFVLKTPGIDTNKKVSIDVKQQTIREVLQRLFYGQDVSFDINKKTVRIYPAEKYGTGTGVCREKCVGTSDRYLRRADDWSQCDGEGE